jgi:hypothetical protein
LPKSSFSSSLITLVGSSVLLIFPRPVYPREPSPQPKRTPRELIAKEWWLPAAICTIFIPWNLSKYRGLEAIL